MPLVYLALGTNLGDRAGNLRQALAALNGQFGVEAVSPVYETEPAYILDQPRFYNLAARAQTALSPLQTLTALKHIEADLGREPGLRFGPRLIDLDLLLYDSWLFSSPELVLPHPRLHERAFVLVPLHDLAPDLVHPKLGLTIHALLEKLPDEEKRKVWPVPLRSDEQP